MNAHDQLIDARSPDGMIDAIDCFSFYCQPNQLKINAEQVSILTVQIKVNTDLLLNEEKVDQKLLKCPLNKLLVARLKNSQVLFSFFVSITLVEWNVKSLYKSIKSWTKWKNKTDICLWENYGQQNIN